MIRATKILLVALVSLWGLLGALAVASLFFGWVIVGEFVFMMFLDSGLAHAASAAFRYGGFIALIMIFVAQRE